MQRIKDFWVNIPKKYKFTFGILTSVLTLTIISLTVYNYYFNKPKSLFDDGNWQKLEVPNRPTPAFVLTAQEEKKFGISSKETFILTTLEPTTVEEVKASITSSSPVKVAQKSDKEFEITPLSNLDPEETITFSIKQNDKTYNWAFQVAPQLKVVSSLPANEAKDVPTNAGVEIIFNTDQHDSIAKEIEVSPNFDYRLEKHNERLAIIPINPLSPKSVYEVKINSLDYSFSFQTSDVENSGRFTLNENLQQVLPSEQLQSKLNFNGNFDKFTSIKTEVYKFNGLNDFINSREIADETEISWENYYGEENKLDLSKVSKVSEANLQIQNQDQLNYLQLPFNLDEGFYFIQFSYSGGEKLEHLWVQSTPVLGYLSVAKEQTAIWLNSVTEPVGESTISMIGSGDNYLTNNEGWVSFTTPQYLFDGKRHYVGVNTASGKELVLPVINLENNSKPNENTQDDYWSYLYNERMIYKPTDTIYFWGVAKNKDTGEVPSVVDVTLGDLKESFSTNSDGSFVGKIDLKDFPVGYHYLSLFVNNVELSGSYVSIMDFTKPQFKIEVTTDKKAIYANDKTNFKGKISFFDGTPASYIPLNIYSGNGGSSSVVNADKNGEFSYVYESKYTEGGYYPRYETVTVSPQAAESGVSEEFGTILVYGSKLDLTSKGTQNGSSAKVEASISNVDLNRINDQGLDDPKSGPATNQKIKVEINKNWYEKKEKGTYYDFVEKVTRKTYDYVYHQEKLADKEFVTNNEGKINFDMELEKDRSYSVTLSSLDKEGRKVSSQQYFYYYDGQSSQNDNKKAEITLENKENSFSVGEEVNVKISKNNEAYKDTESNKFLFVLANRGRQEVFVRDTPELSFNFEDRYKPNVYVGSIIFNGKYYEEVTSVCRENWSCGGYDYYSKFIFAPIQINYKKEDSNLDFTISADKIKYAPGDSIEVKVNVSKAGQAVPNTSVQLVLVDEALAAMGKVNEPSPLSSLYKTVSSFVYYNYYSHQPLFPDSPMAERGGGGGDRDLFKDTAFFGTATTDENGVAQFNFTLPDNITNWLTYAQGITNNMEAGEGETSIIASKEFFVTSQFPKTITLQDNPYLAFNSYGTILNGNVSAEVVFSKESSEVSKSNLTISPFKENYIAFPKLDIGEYQIAARGNYKDSEDGVILPLNVIDSRLEFNLVEKLNNAKDISYKKDKPLKLLVTDEGRGKYYYNLKNYCYVDSNRVERLISKMFASYILSAKFNEDECLVEEDLSVFQAADGGIRQVKWGNSDLETTLWTTYIDANKFDKEKLVKYFENIAGNTHGRIEDQILSNWGLTLLGKPQVNNLVRLSKSATTFKEKTLSALSLEYAGQTEMSKDIYFDLLANYAYTNKPYIRIQAGDSMDSYLLDTSYMLLLGSKFESEYNSGMGLYIRDYRTEAENVILEVSNIAFINNELSKLPDEDTEVTVKSKYQNTVKNLSNGDTVNINLKDDELSTLVVTTNKGKSESTINYFATTESFDKLEGDDRLSLKKTIKKIQGDPEKIKLGDILEVSIDYDFTNDAPLGCYDLTDHISSGLTYLDNPQSYGITLTNRGYLYESGGNIAKGCAYNSPWWRRYSNNSSVYYVKVSSVGKYINEPAVMQSRLDPTIFQKTPTDYITVEQ